MICLQRPYGIRWEMEFGSGIAILGSTRWIWGPDEPNRPARQYPENWSAYCSKVTPTTKTIGVARQRVWTHRISAALGVLLLSCIPPGHAQSNDPLVLMVQPVLSMERSKEAYQPLADYIGKVTGRRCVVQAKANFFSYWETVRNPNGYDLVLDAAHFTDYRVQKSGFKILVKAPDTTGYSLVVPKDNRVTDPDELIGERIATMGLPSIGAAQLAALYPNPVRQPYIVEIPDAEIGIEMVLSKQVRAAILPTPLVAERLAQGAHLGVVITTEPIPHLALSAAADMDPETRSTIRAALLDADKTDTGKRMLQAIGFERFDPATPEMYVNQSNILKEFWGY